jgi:hypothetical protein
MPEAGSVTINSPYEKGREFPVASQSRSPKTTLASCREDDTRLNVVKNRSFLRFGTFDLPVTFTCFTALRC